MPSTKLSNIIYPFKRTRFAPTPSGFLHVGNIFSFSLAAGLAARHGAETLLRIDDLDRQRTRPAYLQDIFDSLHFLSLPWDIGPSNAVEFERSFSQQFRRPLYERALRELALGGHVFACTCSRQQLQSEGMESGCVSGCLSANIPLDTPQVSWRLRTRADEEVIVHRYDGEEQHAMLPTSMKEFVVRKKDGEAAYQLASLMDDLQYGIDMIVRGDDLWPSTIAQLCLASRLKDATPFLNCRFLHHPLLHEGDGAKLSKSAGSTSIQYLRNTHSAGEIFSLTARLAGFSTDITNWKELAEGFFQLPG